MLGLAAVSGAAFGIDALLWKAGATPNMWAPTLLRAGVETALLAGGFLATRSWRNTGLTAKKAAAVSGSGAMTAVGVLLLGYALGTGAEVGPTLLINSVTLAGVAFVGGALWFGDAAPPRRWLGLAVGAAGIALMH